MIDWELSLRDIERNMEEGKDGYLAFTRLRYRVRCDFRILRQKHRNNPKMRGLLLQMNKKITESYEVLPLGQQMRLLGQAISFGKLIEYEVNHGPATVGATR